MFTGIVEELGFIEDFNRCTNGATVKVKCQKVLQDTQIGDSIAINGVCQTVTNIDSNTFTAKISDETLAVTTFNLLKNGDSVNLERALTLNSRLGGHIVSGHVDCCGKLISKEKLTDFYNLHFEIPVNQQKYIVRKGSVTINGISLTIAEENANTFNVAVIPHTFDNTNLKYLNIGDAVNIETDILGKYVEKILSAKDNSNSNISMNFLQENGFL
ncbi:riboflavin synthase [bacterium]|nr:riboflavin synthase [bacterium]